MATEKLPLTLTKADLARELNVSVRTVERMRRAGVLPPTVPGLKRPRFSTAAIVAWLYALAQERAANQQL